MGELRLGGREGLSPKWPEEGGQFSKKSPVVARAQEPGNRDVSVTLARSGLCWSCPIPLTTILTPPAKSAIYLHPGEFRRNNATCGVKQDRREVDVGFQVADDQEKPSPGNP